MNKFSFLFSKAKGLGLAATLLFTPMTHADIPWFPGELNQASDNAAGYLINSNGSGDTTIDIGDRLRGFLRIETIEDLTGGGGKNSLLSPSQATELTAVYDITAVSKTPLPDGGFQIVFAATDGAHLGPGPVPPAGTLIRFFEDPTKDFTRLLSAGMSDDGDPGLTGADLGSGPFVTEETVGGTAASGSPYWDFGLTGNPSEGWVFRGTDNVLQIRNTAAATGLATNNFALGLTANYSGQPLGAVPSAFGGTVDINGTFSFLGVLQVQTPFDHFGNMDAVLKPEVPFSAALGDFVWEDCNGNGIQDQADCDGDGSLEDEPGVGGVAVNLLSPGADGCGTDDESILQTDVTDANGFYLFTDLNPGDYCVEFVKPAGFECTLANQGTNNAVDSDVMDQGDGTCQTVDPNQNPINLGSGETDLSWDAGLVRPASLGDFVWNDKVRNDLQDTGEPGLAGTLVTLLDCDGNQVTTDLDGSPISPITTDGTGFYEFTNLPPGGYQVSFSPPAGFTFVTPKAGGDDIVDSDALLQGDDTGLTACTTLASGENNPDIDAGLYEIGESRLGDLVWNDLDADGIQENINGVPDGEPGIEGIDVELWLCDDAEGNPTTDTGLVETTNASGFYLFDNLTSGSYAVRFPVESMTAAGWKVSPQNAGGDDAKDSDADPTSGFTACVDLGVADENLTLDAGFFKPASLGDFVWNDLERNDVQDPKDEPLAGILVTLLDCDGNQITTDVDGNPISPVTTDAEGFYEFTNLQPGGYQVRFTSPAGFTFVDPNAGAENVDSDAVPQGDGTGLTDCSTLVSGENNPDIDAGLFEIAKSRLGDLVWNDLDADGIQDNINGDPDGEPGIPGVRVELFQCDGGIPATDPVRTADTNEDGFYIFEQLVAGSYAVRFPVESMTEDGWKVSPLNAGADDTIDSDANPADGFTDCVTLGVSDENLTLDAGFFKPASLGDFVWDDGSVTRNDVQDAGEEGVANTLVTLEDCFGNPVTIDADGFPTIGPITTDANGFYEFTNLRPGGYQVRFVIPADYEFVTPNAGPENVDSDALAQLDGSGLSQCVTLISNENNPYIDAGIFLAIPDCDLTVEKTCQVVEPPALDFVCKDAKPLDVLTMISAEQRTISEIAYYRDKYDPKDPGNNLIGIITGPINLGDEVAASGYAAADAKNDVDWVVTFSDGTTGVSRYHRSCSDDEMNGPEDCGKLQGNSKDNDSNLLNTWLLEGLAGNGLALDCTASDPLPSTTNACEFDTPAPPHCLGKVEAISFRYLDGDCIIEPNDQEGKAKCLLPGSAGEPVQILVSDGGSKVYLDTGAPGTVNVGDIVTATAANAGRNEFGANSVIEIFSETGTLVQEVEFHTSCSKPLNLGDRYGSVEVVAMDTTEGGSASLGAEVRYDYTFTNNITFPFTGKAVDDQLGTVLDPLVLAGIPDPDSSVTTSKTVFVLPDETDLLTNTVTVTADNGAFCGDASATVTRVPPPVDDTCSDCEGKVTQLTLQYNGPSAAVVRVEQKKDGKVVFNGVVAAGGQFTFSGQDKNGTLGTEISIFVDDGLNAKIHTSCSQPIGPGLVAGDFEVIEGYSLKGGLLCPVEPIPEVCGCDGKVTELTLAYDGADPVFVEVIQKKDDDTVFSGTVLPGSDFSFIGTDKDGTLSTEISIYVDGVLNAKIHTSCSQPIGPGLVAGDFTVIDGSSRNIPELCPID